MLSSQLNRFATDSQLLLLRAALLAGPPAIDAANAWLDAHRELAHDAFQDLDSGSRRLLPLVYQNVKNDIPAAMRNELKAVHRHYWTQNQQLFRKLEAMLALLQAAEIPTLVLKGAALSVLHYRDMATRPMSDFDILVPEEHGPMLVRKFLEEGWAHNWVPETAPYTGYFYRFRHALDLMHPQQGTVDLHWHVMFQATHKGADEQFWADSIPLSVKSIATRALNPSDQLLHSCLHGYEFNDFPSIRWITDAVTVIRTSQIDWGRIIRVATGLRVTIPCAEQFEFLNSAFDAGVPASCISRLAQQPVSNAERRYFRRMTADPFLRSWWETLEDVWEATSRANRDRAFSYRLLYLPRHLQFQQELRSLPTLIPHAFVFFKRRFA